MKQTLAAPLRYEAESIKGSRFIVDLAPVTNENQARDLVAVAAAKYPDASHHCSAWRIASPAIERANDDGEPSGSAGRPILAQLVGRELIDAAAVVTRYFGGTKLGVGGLVRAYSGSTGQALDSVDLVPWIEMTEVDFSHSYAITDTVDRLLAEANGISLRREFGEQVNQRIQLPLASFADFAATLANTTAGEIQLTLD